MHPGERRLVLILDPLHEDAVDRLRADFDVQIRLQPPLEQLLELVPNADVIVLRSGVRLTAAVFERATRLRLVARAGAGVDNIDLEAARRAGVQAFNVPGGSGGAVAELAMGLTIAVMRKISLADRQVRAGHWRKPELEGVELAGKTLGVIGFGAIGSRIGTLARGFSMHVLTTVAKATKPRRGELAAAGIEMVNLATLLRESDVVCVAVPPTADTRGMLGPAEFSTMRNTAFLVNVSRGGIVDEEALFDALRQGALGGAALDVHMHEKGTSVFAALDNIVLTPHIGAMSIDAQRIIGGVVVDSIKTALAGGTLAHRVC